MKERLPKYLHQPLQILWFNVEELGIAVVFYLMAVIFGGWWWLSVVAGPYLYMNVSRGKPRGYLKHVLYGWGIYELEGYPSPFTK